MKMKRYKFKRSTRRYKEGDVVEFNPDHPHTRQRLERGIIQAVAPHKKRETKVVKPSEVKDGGEDD